MIEKICRTESSEAKTETCYIRGLNRKNLNPKIVTVLDKYFEYLGISSNGVIWKLREAVIPNEVIGKVDIVNREIHLKTLIPLFSLTEDTDGYDLAKGSRIGIVFLGVSKTKNKMRLEMEAILEPELIFASRLNHAMALNLQLLLTGKHALEDEKELMDDKGVLSATLYGIYADDRLSDRFTTAHDKCLASASPDL